MYWSLSLSLFLYLSLSLYFFGQVMSPHHSDQMSQRSQVSKGHSVVLKSKGFRVTRSPIDLSDSRLDS